MAGGHPTQLNERVMATMSKSVEELEQELAELKASKGTANVVPIRSEPLEGTIDGVHDGLFLHIGAESFECRRVSTTYQMMKFAKAQRDAQITIPKGLPEDSPRFKELTEKRNQAGMLMMALLLETATILLKPNERERFDEYMTELSMSDKGLEPGALENAIGETIAAAGGQTGKAEQTTSQPSAVSSLTTKQNSAGSSRGKATAGTPRRGKS